MSGPIVRKYGFPNFEQIFGKRELQHGVDDSEESAQQAAGSAAAETSSQPAPKAKAKPKAKKKS